MDPNMPPPQVVGMPPPTVINQQPGMMPQPTVMYSPPFASNVQPNVITTAPVPMNASGPAAPYGLEYLQALDQILIHQQIQISELVFNWEANNKFIIKNSLGQQCYNAKEDTDCWLV